MMSVSDSVLCQWVTEPSQSLGRRDGLLSPTLGLPALLLVFQCILHVFPHCSCPSQDPLPLLSAIALVTEDDTHVVFKTVCSRSWVNVCGGRLVLSMKETGT